MTSRNLNLGKIYSSLKWCLVQQASTNLLQRWQRARQRQLDRTRRNGPFRQRELKRRREGLGGCLDVWWDWVSGWSKAPQFTVVQKRGLESGFCFRVRITPQEVGQWFICTTPLQVCNRQFGEGQIGRQFKAGGSSPSGRPDNRQTEKWKVGTVKNPYSAPTGHEAQQTTLKKNLIRSWATACPVWADG